MTKVDEAIENIIEYAQNYDISVERNREKFEFLLELYYDARREETDWAEEVERQEAMEFAECFSESE